jgi:hypothetical protein
LCNADKRRLQAAGLKPLSRDVTGALIAGAKSALQKFLCDGRVVLSCEWPGPKCWRAGQYRKQNLIARFGPDIRLPDLREKIAQCGRHGQMHDACVHYLDLVPKRS